MTRDPRAKNKPDQDQQKLENLGSIRSPGLAIPGYDI